MFKSLSEYYMNVGDILEDTILTTTTFQENHIAHRAPGETLQ